MEVCYSYSSLSILPQGAISISASTGAEPGGRLGVARAVVLTEIACWIVPVSPNAAVHNRSKPN